MPKSPENPQTDEYEGQQYSVLVAQERGAIKSSRVKPGQMQAADTLGKQDGRGELFN